MRTLGVLACAAAVLALAGCGTTTNGNPAPTPANGPLTLLDRLSPTGGFGASVIDVLRVRADLHLLGPTDPRAAYASTDPAQRRFAAMYSVAVPLLGLPEDIPALTAIDLRRITAAATNGVGGGPHQVVVLATDQPFSEIADKLHAVGYTGQGDVLTNNQLALPIRSASVIAGSHGVVAIGADAATVRAAAEGTAGGIHGVARDLLTQLNAPAAAVVTASSGCIQAVAIADDVTGGRGRLAVVTAAPQADRLVADQPNNDVFGRFTFDAPSVSGNQITAGFTYPRTVTAQEPMTLLYEASGDRIYRC